MASEESFDLEELVRIARERGADRAEKFVRTGMTDQKSHYMIFRKDGTIETSQLIAVLVGRHGFKEGDRLLDLRTGKFVDPEVAKDRKKARIW